MSWQKVFSILLAFLMIFSGYLILLNGSSADKPLAGNTLFVGPSFTHKTIQSAIDNASDGDTIIVENFTYFESVLINKSNITLIGLSTTDCKIIHQYEGTNSLSNYAAGINVTANGVIITGFNISVSGNYTYGIRFNNIQLSNSTITNNNISTTGYRGHGIFLYQSSNNSIVKNNITTTGIYGNGIYLYQSANDNNIVNCSINTSNEGASGIYILTFSKNNEILNNTINVTGYNANGIKLSIDSNNNTFINNTVNTSGEEGHGIFLSSVSYNNLINNIIETSGLNTSGIYLQSSSNHNTITENNASWNDDRGIYLRNSNQNYISNNKVFNNLMYGIHFYNSDHNIIRSNNITDNINHGIYFQTSSDDNEITHNTIIGNKRTGIYFNSNLNFNTISNNTILGNFWDGIGLETNVNHNYIVNNTISENLHSGIILYDGINNTINDNTVSVGVSSYNGIRLNLMKNCNITKNKIKITVDNGYGIRLQSNSENINVINNSIDSSGNSSYGIWIQSNSDNATVLNNTIKATGSGAFGVLIEDSNHSYLSSCYINTTGTNSIAYYLDGEDSTLVNSTFESSIYLDIYIINNGKATAINCSFSTLDVTSDGAGVLIVRNYLQLQTYYQDGLTPIQDADVLVKADNFIHYASTGYGGTQPWTDINGQISPILITDRWYNRLNNPIENFTNVSIKKTVNRTWEIWQLVNMSTTHTEVFVAEDIIAPPKPAKPKVTRVGNDNTLNISWAQNPDTVNYSVYYSIGGCLYLFLRNVTHPQNWTWHQNLQDEYYYQYKILAWDAVGLPSMFSESTEFYLEDITPPAIPENLSARPIIGDDAINISWDKNLDDTLTYDLWWSESISSGWAQAVNLTFNINTTIFINKTLTNGTEYYIKIRAWDEVDLASNFSDPVSVIHRDYLPPTKPKNLTVKAISEYVINLTWGASDSYDVTGYRIYINSSGTGTGGPYDIIDQVTATALQYHATNLLENVVYYFAVKAFDEAINPSEFSNEAWDRTISVPPKKPFLELLPNFTNQLMLKIKGTAEVNTTVQIVNNNVNVSMVKVISSEIFETDITLVEDTNVIKAQAIDNAILKSGFTDSQVVTLDSKPPLPDAGSDIDLTLGEKATFNASRSNDNYEITNYSWIIEFDDMEIEELYGKMSYYEFDIMGLYTVTLKVIDIAGNFATDFIIVNVTEKIVSRERPEVENTSPINNSKNIGLTVIVIITFSLPMDSEGFENAVDVKPTTDYNLIWSPDNKNLSVVFTRLLEYDTNYIITISKEARATTGGRLNNTPFILIFETEPEFEEPTISITSPINNTQIYDSKIIIISGTSNGLPENTEITVTLRGIIRTTTIAEDGYWSLEIQAPSDPGDYVLEVKIGDLKEVLNLEIIEQEPSVDGKDKEKEEKGFLGLGPFGVWIIIIILIVILILIYLLFMKKKKQEEEELEEELFEEEEEEGQEGELVEGKEEEEVEEKKEDITGEVVNEMFECPDCGTSLTADTTICYECGTEFEEEEEDVEVEKGEEVKVETVAQKTDAIVHEAFECPDCGTSLTADATICHECGAEFED